jgi:uncharacterized Zn-finger protein
MFDIRQPGFGLAAWEDEGGSTARHYARAAPPGPASRPGAPRYFNDVGAMSIGIGGEALNCIGATPPADHPHVYLNLTDQADILCPYCSTRFFHDPRLGRHETKPPGCFYDSGAGAPRADRRADGIP